MVCINKLQNKSEKININMEVSCTPFLAFDDKWVKKIVAASLCADTQG